ncbi:ABC transporter substrate-binding protein [Qingshengfaniella alkalisoli]|uniref:Probable sugar-binding periplasmic protein n=1 Tax=Qingshengfaniella alkalisoli TaxID=2599296 RepID=A0A5B8IWA0_9RHOB|nr:ABC transporter substrate-binding protein [Qingshengfaniella alkalisoli]QDY70432.1 carbohydrate ABC transporter substrate-binding protein [Qingshengfaniella alkalisoli]
MSTTIRLTAATAFASLLAASVQAEELVIYQKWSSPAEVAALNVLHEGAAELGIEWIDITIPHDTGSNVNLLNLVTGGKPPNIFSENNPAVYRDLEQMGLARPLTSDFEKAGVTQHLPPSVIKSITVDGEIMKFPLGIHIDGMLFYNKEVAEKAGVSPEGWTSLDDMHADFDKIREAGAVPLALGAQAWQIGYLTHALIATTGGVDLFESIYGPEPKVEALDDPAVAETFDWLRKFQQAADEGSINRDWNMTANTVINGDALMQIHGDWMKGEWLAAGKVPGKDFGCIQIPGSKALSVTVDAWGLLGDQPEAKDKAELDFALMAVSPEINAEFAAKKGSTPVRTDIPTENLDVCSQEVMTILEDPTHQVQNPHSMVDADWQSSVWEVAFNFWSDPDMSTEDAVSELKNNFDIILN